MPAADAAADLGRAGKAAAAARNDTTARDLFAEGRADESLWLDECGRALYLEPRTTEAHAAHAAHAAAAVGAAPLVPLEQTFALHSRPGSARTIYLDFTGETVTDSIWNDHVGAETFSVPAYSIDTDPRFSSAELTEIQRAWAVVAEDYAPFDVDVTTADPGHAALARSSSLDQQYGDRVVITASGPVHTWSGGAGGVSYLDIIGVVDSTVSSLFLQPSWVFTKGTGADDGTDIAEAVSHEVGHAFGLDHDGIGSSGYSTGSAPWAPIMGASYYHPVTQWSMGEYADATNREDDTARIARTAPYVADDHADAWTAATAVATEPRSGLIGTRQDRDAFTFSAAGPVEVRVTPTALMPNLDVAATVLDAAGNSLGTIAPPVAQDWAGRVTGLDAAFRIDAPAGGATFTVVVDGVGSGDPRTAGRYSDYGSLGAYRFQVTPAAGGSVLPTPVTTMPEPPAEEPEPSVVTVQSDAPAPPPVPPAPQADAPPPVVAPPAPLPRAAELRRTWLPAARLHRRYRGRLLADTHGSALAWTASGTLPRGVRILASADGSTVTLAGTPRRSGRFRITLTGLDPHGRSLTAAVTLRVRR